MSVDQTALRQFELLEQFAASSAANWKVGYDAAGFEQFIYTLKQLEYVTDAYYDALGGHSDRLFSIVNDLYRYMKNRDIIAIGDVLEYDLQPFIGEWKKGCEIE